MTVINSILDDCFGIKLKPFNELDKAHRMFATFLTILVLISLAVIPVIKGVHDIQNVMNTSEPTTVTMRSNAILDIEHPSLKKVNNNATPMQKTKFVKTMGHLAIHQFRVHHNYNVLPSVLIAQAIVESKWGQSSLDLKANNFFGMKYNGVGSSVSLPTTEYINGNKITEMSKWQKFSSVQSDIHYQYWTLYHKFIKQPRVMSYQKEIKLIKANHYATDPNYVSTLINVINAYHLQKYDLEGLK